MMEYDSKFRIEAQFNNTRFVVQVKTWLGWKDGFLATDFFSLYYDSILKAEKAIKQYKDRFTYTKD